MNHDIEAINDRIDLEIYRRALREIVRMASRAADAPATSERWLERIEEEAINALGSKR